MRTKKAVQITNTPFTVIELGYSDYFGFTGKCFNMDLTMREAFGLFSFAIPSVAAFVSIAYYLIFVLEVNIMISVICCTLILIFSIPMLAGMIVAIVGPILCRTRDSFSRAEDPSDLDTDEEHDLFDLRCRRISQERRGRRRFSKFLECVHMVFVDPVSRSRWYGGFFILGVVFVSFGVLSAIYEIRKDLQHRYVTHPGIWGVYGIGVLLIFYTSTGITYYALRGKVPKWAYPAKKAQVPAAITIKCIVENYLYDGTFLGVWRGAFGMASIALSVFLCVHSSQFSEEEWKFLRDNYSYYIDFAFAGAGMFGFGFGFLCFTLALRKSMKHALHEIATLIKRNQAENIKAFCFIIGEPLPEFDIEQLTAEDFEEMRVRLEQRVNAPALTAAEKVAISYLRMPIWHGKVNFEDARIQNV